MGNNLVLNYNKTLIYPDIRKEQMNLQEIYNWKVPELVNQKN
tara:strand:+ start:182 stop:307 length:126 start_codon:yes stop_codon:yes gene_type:complete